MIGCESGSARLSGGDVPIAVKAVTGVALWSGEESLGAGGDSAATTLYLRDDMTPMHEPTPHPRLPTTTLPVDSSRSCDDARRPCGGAVPSRSPQVQRWNVALDSTLPAVRR